MLAESECTNPHYTNYLNRVGTRHAVAEQHQVSPNSLSSSLSVPQERAEPRAPLVRLASVALASRLWMTRTVVSLERVWRAAQCILCASSELFVSDLSALSTCRPGRVLMRESLRSRGSVLLFCASSSPLVVAAVYRPSRALISSSVLLWALPLPVLLLSSGDLQGS
jgi:hypothetical protein